MISTPLGVWTVTSHYILIVLLTVILTVFLNVILNLMFVTMLPLKFVQRPLREMYQHQSMCAINQIGMIAKPVNYLKKMFPVYNLVAGM